MTSAGERETTGWSICPHPRCGEDLFVALGPDGEILRIRTRVQAHQDAAREAVGAASFEIAWRAGIAALLVLVAVALLVQWKVACVATSIAIVASAPWVAGYDLQRIRRAAEVLDGLPRVDVQLAAIGAGYRG